VKHITIINFKEFSSEQLKLLKATTREDDFIIEMNDFFKLLETLTTEKRKELEWKLKHIKLNVKQWVGND
jgi:hypothetical protein